MNIAACEGPVASKGSFAASIQQFSLPPDLARLFSTKPSRAKKASVRSSGKSVRKASDKAAKDEPSLAQAKAIELEAEEVRNILTGNSLYAGGGGLEFAAIHKPDGAMAGRAWSAEGTTQGSGSWRIDADGTYCRKWDNQWADGEWGCFKLLRKDSKLSLQRVSGAGADGDMTLVPGNAYGL